jgi:hypothetical protein
LLIGSFFYFTIVNPLINAGLQQIEVWIRVATGQNLTTRRYALISELNKLRQNDDINSCWSYDGRIFAKVHEDSEKTLIKDLNDIDLLRRESRPQSVEVQH